MVKKYPMCRLPKRKNYEWIIGIVGICAGLITIAGKLNVFSIGLTTAPVTTTTPQEVFVIVLGVIILILVAMFWSKSRK